MGLLVLAALLVPSPAEAADEVVTGSWTQLRAAAAAPDLQQTDGHALPVANSVLGPLAFAAVRVPVGAATLELTRVDAGGGVSVVSLPQAVVWACPTTTRWSPGDRQPWAERPTYDCAKHAVGSPSGAGMFWDLAGLRGDLALVPAPADPMPYSLTFQAPTTASFQVPTPAAPSLPSAAPAPVATQDPVALEPPPLLPPPAAVVPVPSAAPAPVTVTGPQPAAAVVPASLRDDVAPASHTGAALLAFLALLLMLRAAVPAAASGAPRALVSVSPDRGAP